MGPEVNKSRNSFEKDAVYDPKITFVIGGGAIKALAFQVGVAKGLQEHGFSFESGLKSDPTPEAIASEAGHLIDSYIGSSAGAAMAVILANGYSHQDVYEILVNGKGDLPNIGYSDFVKAFFKRMVHLGKKKLTAFDSPMSFLKSIGDYRFRGIPAPIRLDFIEEYFREHVIKSNDFNDYRPQIFITATQLNHTRKVIFGPLDSVRGDATYDPYCAYYNDVDVSSSLAASMSLPGLFAPFPIVSKNSGTIFHYYDGALKDTLSTHISNDIRSDFCIVSNIHIPYIYNEQHGDLSNRNLAHHTSQAIAHLIEQKVSQYRRGQMREKEIMLLAEELLSESKEEKTTEFLQALRRILNFRDVEVLYVAPSEDEFEFLFSPHFSFNPDTLKLGVEVGYRSLCRAIDANPEFLNKLKHWKNKNSKNVA